MFGDRSKYEYYQTFNEHLAYSKRMFTCWYADIPPGTIFEILKINGMKAQCKLCLDGREFWAYLNDVVRGSDILVGGV